MDADVEGVVVFVKEADDLLGVAVGGDFLQSAEAAHAVVDMGDIVAWLKLEEFLEGEGLMGVAHVADGVFVVALEDFVVGEAEEVLGVVDKAVVGLALEELDMVDDVVDVDAAAIVEGDGVVGGVGAGKDFLKASLLLLVGDGDDGAVAAVAVLGEGVDKEVELLVERRLGLREGLDGGGVGEVVAVALLDDAATEERLEELVAGAVVLAVLSGIGEEGLDGFGDEHEPLYPYEVVAAEIVDKGHLLLDGDGVGLAGGHIGQDADLVVLLDGELRDGVEGAEGLDGGVEEFDTVRVLVGKGEDVISVGAFGQAEGVAGKCTRRDHLLVECLGIGDDGHGAAAVELLDHLAALKDVGVVGGEEVAAVVVDLGRLVRGTGLWALATGFAVGGGEEQCPFLVEIGIGLLKQHFDVVEHVVCFLLVACDYQLVAVGVEQGDGGGHYGRERPRHTMDVDAVFAGMNKAVDFFNNLRISVYVG